MSDRGIDLFLESVAQWPALGKAIAFFSVWIFLWLPIAIPLSRLLKWRPPQPITIEQKLPLLASVYLIAPLIIWGASWVEGESFINYGWQPKASALVSLTLGLGLGVFGLALVFGLQSALGWVNWHWPDENPPPNFLSIASSILLPTLLIALLVSGIEELVFRGFLLNKFQQDYSNWVAGAICSLIFAFLHLLWEQQETTPQLPGLWLMGMVLTLARWVDGGSLGLAIGIHAGWIWAMASLDTAQVINYTGKGSVWLTGLGGKPLAGVAGDRRAHV